MAQTVIEGPRFFRLSAAAGLTTPLDLKDSRNLGLGVRGSLTTGEQSSPLAFRVDLFYERFGVKGVTDGHAGTFGGTVNALLYMSTTLDCPRPYLVAGLGAARTHLTVRDAGLSYGTGVSGMIFNAGVGLEIPVSSHALFVEALLRGRRASGYTWWVPVVVGITF